MDLKKHIREIPDFPKPGISFKDITTLLKNKEAYRYAVGEIFSAFCEKKITKVVSLESRGFIIGGALAYVLEAGFVPIRKAGKLPADKVAVDYDLEYGCDSIEIHKDALIPEDVVLIHDDLLATGGTALAAWKLVRQFNVREIYFSFLCDLRFIETPQKHIVKSLSPQILFFYD
jgi:adenine phosphoribosyltransferase